jgi:hypothetical protein
VNAPAAEMNEQTEEIMPDFTTRPTVATIFGILDILFGALGISSIYVLDQPRFSIALLINGAVALVSVLAVAAGIFLLKNRPVALKLNLHFSCASIALAVIWLICEIISSEPGGLMAGIFSIATTILYPVLVIVILLRDKTVKDYYQSR